MCSDAHSITLKVVKIFSGKCLWKIISTWVLLTTYNTYTPSAFIYIQMIRAKGWGIDLHSRKTCSN